MCGISGIIDTRNKNDVDITSAVKTMSDMLIHRGPDDSDIWISRNKNIVLAHRRLSIQDLSMNGRQPMISKSQNYVLVFNGEIYNFKSLKKQIHNYEWESSSDTEVILAFIEKYGFHETINKLNGMFSILLYDIAKNKFYAAVDRFGEKPFYYYFNGNKFLFASELKSLMAVDNSYNLNLILDKEAHSTFSSLSYIPAPQTIFKNVFKLEPGHYLEGKILDGNKIELSNDIYFSFSSAINNAKNNPFEGTYNDSVAQLKDKLRSVIEKQLISDAPIGCFLSGGIDSSLITSIASECSSSKINTFSMGFDDDNYNESKFAKEIGNFLGTNHTEFIVNPSDALSLVSSLPEVYDEPFADSSQIPTILLSQITAKSVKVALSGDAGDEVFGGYNRYIYANKIWNIFRSKPETVRNIVKNICIFIDSNNKYIPNLINKNLENKFPQFREKLSKIIRILNHSSEIDIYNELISNNNSKNLFNDHNNAFNQNKLYYVPDCIKDSFVDLMMYLDTTGYLPGDILTKVDRASMSSSLETRIPFLDIDLIKYSWSLPTSYKVSKRHGKIILKDCLKSYIPETLFMRPKKGFNIPLADWLRGPLKEWMLDNLNSKKISSEGLYDSKSIEILINDHINNDIDNHNQLWNILVFQSWRAKYKY